MSGEASPDDGKIKVTAEYLSVLNTQALLKKINDINQVIALSEKIRGGFYEELTGQYRDASGRLDHASDCAIHNAPAECPGPCDCDSDEENPSVEEGIGMLLNSRYWLQKAMKAHGAIITGSGLGMGQADIDIELGGQRFVASIRPLPAVECMAHEISEECWCNPEVIRKGSQAAIEFCLEYVHQGKKWALNFFAESLEDAESKVQSIKDSLVLLGKLEEKIPVSLTA